MKSTFFARRGLLIVCLIFFLIPFGIRGARLSLQRMKNDVKDWLPKAFKETREVEWFAEHFVGEQFVVVSWPNCSTDDPRYHEFLEKLRSEMAPGEGTRAAGATWSDDAVRAPLPEGLNAQQRAAVLANDQDARELGNKLELFYAGDFHENWGGRGERWLKGQKHNWYFITPDGTLYRWPGGGNMIGLAWRGLRRSLNWGLAEGIPVARLGRGDQGRDVGEPNRYFAEPRLVTAPLFASAVSGPLLRDQLAVEGGPVWPRGSSLTDQEKSAQARGLMTTRLTGALFGPEAPRGFSWTPQHFEDRLLATQREQLPEDWKQRFNRFVGDLVDAQYGGELSRLQAASETRQTKHWRALLKSLDAPPLARQTCFLITLSDVGKRDLSRIVGRPVLGKPPGRLRTLAAECGIQIDGPGDEFHLGGPPVDNVAIDEEGAITLVRLVGFSIIVGVVLSYLSFRSLLVTFLIFTVGGTSAITGLALVYWSGASVDAILLSMPSLVYVLGLSGAVHIVNYYKDAVKSKGREGAPERALAHGWGPCTLAAFTTALGLLSLYASSILPIRKFGLFSALGVMATLVLLFSYLPAALQLWPPAIRRNKRDGAADGEEAPGNGEEPPTLIERFWDRVGRFVIAHHGWVTAAGIVVTLVVGAGLLRIRTSVQLLKLFDGNAKIIRDYAWLEQHLGNLVPIELAIRIPASRMRPPIHSQPAAAEAVAGDAAAPQDQERALLSYNLLERLEIADRIQRTVEREFGPEGQDLLGRGMSAATFAPEIPPAAAPGLSSRNGMYRSTLNVKLEQLWYDQLLGDDYLRHDRAEGHEGSEIWRVSLRLGALNDVDYGQFVHRLKHAVEPILTAHQIRDQVLREVSRYRREHGDDQEPAGFGKTRIILLGAAEPGVEQAADGKSPVAGAGNGASTTAIAGTAIAGTAGAEAAGAEAAGAEAAGAAAKAAEASDPAASDSAASAPEAVAAVDQTAIFCDTLQDLLVNAGCDGLYRPLWISPEQRPIKEMFPTREAFAEALQTIPDCVVLVADHSDYDVDFIRRHARVFIDAREHWYERPQENSVLEVMAGASLPAARPHTVATTAAQRDEDGINVVYTGVVPVVYKAQRTLLISLMQSIGWAFVMIAGVMMMLLRTGRISPLNLLNVRGGLISMLPNVFPVVLIFGLMGHLGILVDIGSMMTASVAMGVAVDDTIHFLTWFRTGIRQGLARPAAIMLAYRRCAIAMTQTTLIGGVGLSVFSVSTFTPTQRFGTLMLTLLAAALLGDLVLLPALLASPWGKYFCPDVPKSPEPVGQEGAAGDGAQGANDPQGERTAVPAPHSRSATMAWVSREE